MKKYAITCVCTIASLYLFSIFDYAQSGLTLSQLVSAVKEPYTELDGSYVSSGYLKDQALDLVRISLFDGQELCDSNYVDVATFCDLFRTMNYAIVNNTATEYNVEAISTSMASSSTVKLSSAVFRYNYIREDAIAQGLIDYDANAVKLYDHYDASAWCNPYAEEYVFMFSAGKHLVESNDVVFDLTNLTLYGNCSISDVLIDFDNGAGYVPVPANNICQISYLSSETKELKLKITLDNNVVLESHTFIGFPSPPVSPSGSGAFAPDTTFTVSYSGISAKCSVKFSNGRTAIKPLIYVEGFDHPVMNELSNFSSTSFANIRDDKCEGGYSFEKCWYDNDRIRHNGYDLFYVDWNNPEADILSNAVLLKEVIHKVNELKPNDGSGERSVVIAHSMGGLITRCALRQMEISNDAHGVDYFISQDVPHLGAVMPIGVQYTIRDIYRCFFVLGIFPSIRTVAGKIAGVLDCTSARQMMYNYINAQGVIDNSVHEQFMSYINTIGFPKGDSGHPIENLSIVSGNTLSASEQSDKLLTFGLSLTQFDKPVSLYALRNFTVYADIDRDRQAGNVVASTIIIYTSVNKLRIPQVHPIMIQVHTSPSTINHLDAAPGSYLQFEPDNSFWTSNPFLYIDYAEKMVFVPASSSLSFSGYNASYNTPSSFVGYSPFHSYCFDENAMPHCNHLFYYLDWIEEQKTMTIDVPPLVLTDDIMTISNKPSGVAEECWSSSDNSKASINDGEITVNDSGVVVLSYRSSRQVDISSHSLYCYYSKHRTVLAGFPAMKLTANHLNGNQYSVTASCVSTDGTTNSMLNSMVNSGFVQYIWGYKDSGNSYDWCDTTSISSHTFIAPVGVKTHICVKLYNGPGRESEATVYDIDRTSTTRFYSDPQEVFVNRVGFSMNYQYVVGISSNKYYAIWCNPNFSDTPVAPDTVVIGVNSYPVVSTLNRTINGDSVTVYCFDIKDDPTLLQRISEVRSGTIPDIIIAGVFLTIKSNGAELENCFLPIISRISGPYVPTH